MKTKNSFTRLGVASGEAWVLPALIAGLNLLPAGRVAAQTFTTLHSFNGGSDGANPFARLILSGNTLYGTAYRGGSSGNGTVFAVNTDATGFTPLHSFAAGSGSYPNYTNSDGAYPYAGVYGVQSFVIAAPGRAMQAGHHSRRGHMPGECLGR